MPRTRSSTLAATGVKAASATKATFEASPKPNQIAISGIQAKTAMPFSASKEGRSVRCARPDRPMSRPKPTPAAAPSAKPARLRSRLTPRLPSRSRCRSCVQAVAAMRSSGGSNRGSASPAVLRAVSDPDRVGREFKRRLGNPMPVTLGGQSFAVTALLCSAVAVAFAVMLIDPEFVSVSLTVEANPPLCSAPSSAVARA